MATPPQFLYREVLFHPPEADRLAENIAAMIRQLITEQSTVNSHVNNLRSDWEGHQKEMFISDFKPHKNKSAGFIDELRRREQFFRSLKVTRQEAYTNPAWEAYEKTKR